jgi:DNA-binding NtrC family response regulator
MSIEATQPVQGIELPSAEFIFGITAGMRGIREGIERAFHDDLPVLIEGESGTGKEVIGRFLHRYSRRSEGPFLNLNCAASPASLLESEIYGYENDATARVQATPRGPIGLASGGTLFFDEIGDLDLSLQRRLAETLASGRYGLCASSEYRAVDARLVFASSADAKAGPQNHRLFEKLLQPFAHYHLRLLPLRERKQDIPNLCEYLLGKFAHEFGRSVPVLSSNALEVFQKWKWPGNIRELENWMARIVIFGAEEAIGLQFNRQLVTWQDPVMRRQAVSRQMDHVRRLRRHS